MRQGWWLWAGLAVTGLAAAEPNAAPSAVEWLQRVSNAARQLNYVGTVVYQHGNRVETSRLFHLGDHPHGEQERLISLEGPLREVVRNNENVTCYFPELRVVRIEQRSTRSAFPALLPKQVATLSENYNFRRGELARVAGIEARAYFFEPKDGLRYGHQFWADDSSGLLLKASMVNDKSEVIEQFMFTDLRIGGKVERASVRPSIGRLPPDWKVLRVTPAEGVVQETGWQVAYLPPGFAKTVEVFRSITGKSGPVAHLVFSDGLVAVSVFVEPFLGQAHAQGLIQTGAINVFALQQGEHLITVLGETPAETVQRIARSVARRQ
ncbi:Sigma factor AlgU regulatory protein MucB [Burkholderiales bacterium]|nr:Sigma factor AlgU regulatory protein MucB [Burkholderiales bacterium]